MFNNGLNKGAKMKNKLYRVFDWDTESEEMIFETLKEAKEEYKDSIKREPQRNWRLYRDTETARGNFIEDCLISNDNRI